VPIPRSPRILVSIFNFALLGSAVAWGQASPAPDTSTLPRLQAELLKTLDPGHLQAGDELTARTVTPLEVAGSKYAPGAIVKGHVTEVDSSHLVLLFDQIQVKKNPPVPLGLSLRAVMMPHAAEPQPSNDMSSEQRSPRAEALGAGGGPMRSPDAAARDSVYMPPQGRPPAAAAPVETRNGGVIGLPGVHLDVNPDPKVGAVFHVEKDQKLRLEKGLQLMFVVSEK
jgi:hypothetical protein